MCGYDIGISDMTFPRSSSFAATSLCLRSLNTALELSAEDGHVVSTYMGNNK